MDKPTKPTDLMPRSFGGTKTNFSSTLQTTGFEPSVPQIYGGANLNYQLNATGQELNYCETICDFINALPIGNTITTDTNNKLVYSDLSNFANISLSNLNATGENKFTVKLNKDHSNDEKPYWKTSYGNGGSGYYILSNGYCEQWGFSIGQEMQYISLLKTYEGTNYQVYLQIYGETDSGNNSSCANIYDVTSSSFKYALGTPSYISGLETVYWRTYGYLANGQY